MAPSSPPEEIVTTADGVPLKRKLRQGERRRAVWAYGLILPLFALTLLIFVVPICAILAESAANPEVIKHLPRTAAALQTWAGEDVPGEDAFAALTADLREGYKARTIAPVTVRLNYEVVEFRSLLQKTARRAAAMEQGPYKEALITVDGRWAALDYWAAIKRNDGPLTAHYYLMSVDLERDARNEIVKVPSDRAIFVQVYGRTFWISFIIAVATLVLGYPVAYLLATLPSRISNLLMIFVLLPFWTSSLVRTVAWVVLLQQNGLINDALVGLGLVNERIQLIFNRPGLLVAMTYVMLPFMILPLYSVMKGIDPQHMRAAKSLGAHPAWAFFTVYLPLSMPGVGAGSLLVFIVSIGFYITPELIGGGRDQMISQFIAVYANEYVNWGQAGALAVLLLAAVGALYVFYGRIAGTARI